MNVLVTDGENRSSLAVTRSLGRAGCAVFVSAARHNTISSCSRFCRKAFCVPDPISAPAEYVKAILQLVKTEYIDVLIPMTEQSIYCLNDHRRAFPEKMTLACTSSDQMKLISNKKNLFELASSLQVPIPETIHVDSAESFFEQEPHIEQFPVVVKPAYSKLYSDNKIISSGVMYASNFPELRQLYKTKEILHHPSLIQEMIPGEGTGLFTLFDSDRHLALFSHRRLLEKPPSGGVSVLSESVKLDENMVLYAQKLLGAVGWRGVAMVEFKRDSRDGIPKLMEINGRFWGSLQLAVSCGVDFPALCLDYYLGKKPLETVAHYAIGRKLRWFLGMLDHVLIRIKRHDSIVNIPPGTLALNEVIAQLLFVGENTYSDVFDKRDLGPFFNELKCYFADFAR
ncbi:carboxylate--amine ligase [Geomonas agri]|uniref:carboxylate--amine ligase n=1 Tax=Geomonas agri TaxID=2873702 RepID=UPI001CD51E4E|nr:ATP-grasp domain-containing protein [Geomonas agri]